MTGDVIVWDVASGVRGDTLHAGSAPRTAPIAFVAWGPEPEGFVFGTAEGRAFHVDVMQR